MLTIPVNCCKLNTISNELISCKEIFKCLNELFNIQMYSTEFHWFWSCYISMDSAGCVCLDVFSNALLNVEHNHL